MEDEIEVELHSTEPSAVEATRSTLAMAPLDSKLIERNGKFYVQTSNPGFIRFALEQQGYVRRIVK